MHRASTRVSAFPPDGDVGLLGEASGFSERPGPEAFALLLPVDVDDVGLRSGPTGPAECRDGLIAVKETVGEGPVGVVGLVVPEHGLTKSPARQLGRVAPGT